MLTKRLNNIFFVKTFACDVMWCDVYEYVTSNHACTYIYYPSPQKFQKYTAHIESTHDVCTQSKFFFSFFKWSEGYTFSNRGWSGKWRLNDLVKRLQNIVFPLKLFHFSNSHVWHRQRVKVNCLQYICVNVTLFHNGSPGSVRVAVLANFSNILYSIKIYTPPTRTFIYNYVYLSVGVEFLYNDLVRIRA